MQSHFSEVIFEASKYKCWMNSWNSERCTKLGVIIICIIIKIWRWFCPSVIQGEKTSSLGLRIEKCQHLKACSKYIGKWSEIYEDEQDNIRRVLQKRKEWSMRPVLLIAHIVWGLWNVYFSNLKVIVNLSGSCFGEFIKAKNRLGKIKKGMSR